MTDTITIAGTATAQNFGIQTLTALPSNGTVVANDLTAFLDTIGRRRRDHRLRRVRLAGEHPVALGQDRQRRRLAAPTPGTCSTRATRRATGTQPAWQNAGINYTFGANGQMNPLVANADAQQRDRRRRRCSATCSSCTARAASRNSPIPNGNVQVNLLQQNGYAAGELQSVSVSDKGRIVGSYSNGRTLDLAEITLANFNGTNCLKRIDGGAFEATDESGARDLRRRAARSSALRSKARTPTSPTSSPS